MAARDRSSHDVNCPECGTTGVVECSENDYPFMRKSDFTVDDVSGLFSVTKVGSGWATTSIECKTCHAKVHP